MDMNEIKSKAIDIVSKLLKEDKVTTEEAKILLEAISDGGNYTTIVQTPQAPHVTPTYTPQIQGPDYPFNPNKIYCDSEVPQPPKTWNTVIA